MVFEALREQEPITKTLRVKVEHLHLNSNEVASLLHSVFPRSPFTPDAPFQVFQMRMKRIMKWEKIADRVIMVSSGF